MPFRSQAQQRFAFGTKQPWAKRWAAETDFSKLPKKIRKKATQAVCMDCVLAGLKADVSGSGGSMPRTPAAPTKPKPAAGGKGEQLAPGVTRIRGNLCNVHGRYGPCDGSAGGKKKPKGRKPRAAKPKAGAKPKQTPEQRAQATTAQHDANRAKVMKQLGLPEDAAGALDDLRAGKPVDDDGGLVKMGLAEQAADGSYRLTASGRALVNAANSGDAGRAHDIMSSASDRKGSQTERQQASDARHAEAEQRRADAEKKRAEAAKKKPAGGGGGGKQSSGDKRETAQTPEQKREENRASVRDTMAATDTGLAPAGFDNLVNLSSGREPDAQGAQSLVDMGLAERGGDGTLRLTASGRETVNAANRGDAKGAIDAISRGRDRHQASQDRAAARTDAQAKRDAAQAQREADRQARQRAQTTRQAAPRIKPHRIPIVRGNRGTRRKASDPGDYLVVEDRTKPSTWHLQVKKNGTPDHRLMGAAWAALHGGYRGNTYDGPQKGEALTKLKRLYASEKMDVPSEKAYQSSPHTQPVLDVATPGVTATSSPVTAMSKTERQSTQRTDSFLRGDAQRTQTWLQTGQGNSHAVVPKNSAARVAAVLIDGIATPPAPSIPQSFAVFKDTAGAWRWIARTTTAFEDRDQEVISTKALEDSAATAGPRGPLRWWHMGRPDPLSSDRPWGPGVDLGWCDFAAISGRTLIESGTFKSEAIAKAVAAHANDLELSPGFFHAAGEPDASGVFSHIRIFERSLVPKWAGRASNPYTGLVVEKAMDQKKIQALKDLGASDAVITELLADVQQTEKAADTDGVRYKDSSIRDLFVRLLKGETVTTKADEPVEAPAVEETAPPVDDPIALLTAELKALREEVTALKAAPVADVVEEKDDGMGDMLPEDGGDPMAAEEAPVEEEAGGLTLSSDDLSAIGQIITAVIEPLIGALGITQKLDGHLSELKTMMSGYTKTKDDAQAALVARLDQTEAKLADLAGDAPRASGYRASQASDNALPALLAAVKDSPTDDNPFADLVQQLFPGQR